MMSLPTPEAARYVRAAAADDKDAGGKDFFQSFDTDFVEKDVAAVTEQLVVVHDEVV